MRKTWCIFKREVGAYFLTPSAYIILFIWLLLSGYFFSTFVLGSRLAEMRPVLSNMAVIFLFLAPALTTRLWSEELRQGTDEMLYTSPISVVHIVLGKWLAALFLFFTFLLITGIFGGILEWYGTVDWKAAAGGYVGLILLGGAALAIGMFASSLTDSQVVAAVVGFGILLGFWVAGWAGDELPGITGKILQFVALTPHYQDFSKGVLDTTHIVYFLSVIGGFLFLTAQRLETARYR